MEEIKKISQNRKFPKEGRDLGLAILLGFLYFVWLRVTNLGIPCVFRKVTGLLCPGCGITTMILCLSRLDWEGAYAANPFLLVTGVPLLADLIWCGQLRCHGKDIPRWNDLLLTVYMAFLLGFGVWRNLPPGY